MWSPLHPDEARRRFFAARGYECYRALSSAVFAGVGLTDRGARLEVITYPEGLVLAERRYHTLGGAGAALMALELDEEERSA